VIKLGKFGATMLIEATLGITMIFLNMLTRLAN
jgi:hypothetical protein